MFYLSSRPMRTMLKKMKYCRQACLAFQWLSRKQTSCHAGKHLIIHVLEAPGDSLVKGGWGNVSQQLPNSPGMVPLDTPFLACAPWSVGLGSLAHGGRDWQLTACFQDWLDEWLKQHDGQSHKKKAGSQRDGKSLPERKKKKKGGGTKKASAHRATYG